MRSVVAALGLFAGGALAACGGGAAGPAASSVETSSSPATEAVTATPTDPPAASAEEATHREPLDDPECGSAELLTTVEIGTQSLTVSETTNGQWFCVDGQPVGLDSSPAWVDAPALTDSGSLMSGGVFHLYVLPADTPTGVTLRDEAGADVPVAQSLDGDHLMILDVDADAQLMGGGEVERRWDVIGPDGAVVLTLVGSGPPAGSAPTTFDDVVACLADNGIAADDPQPVDPASAQRAWSACEALDRQAMVASGMPASDADRALVFVACMAERGWLQVVLDTSAIDVAAHGAAAQECQTG